MTPKELLKEYKNWAVLGVTTDEAKYGYRIYKRLKDLDYNVYGVSPKYDYVDGDKMYTSLDTIPDSIDVVVFVVNPRFADAYIKQMKELGIKEAWMQPGTYNDNTIKALKENDLNITLDCVLIQTQ